MIMATACVMGSRGTPEPLLPHCVGRSFLRVLKERLAVVLKAAARQNPRGTKKKIRKKVLGLNLRDSDIVSLREARTSLICF